MLNPELAIQIVIGYKNLRKTVCARLSQHQKQQQLNEYWPLLEDEQLAFSVQPREETSK